MIHYHEERSKQTAQSEICERTLIFLCIQIWPIFWHSTWSVQKCVHKKIWYGCKILFTNVSGRSSYRLGIIINIYNIYINTKESTSITQYTQLTLNIRYLFKLVNPEYSSGITTMGSDLLSKASWQTSIFDRKVTCRNPFISMEGCYWLLRGSNQILLIQWGIVFLFTTFSNHLNYSTMDVYKPLDWFAILNLLWYHVIRISRRGILNYLIVVLGILMLYYFPHRHATNENII